MKNNAEDTKKNGDRPKQTRLEQDQFATDANDSIACLAARIDALKAESRTLLQSAQDVWTPLGRRAPFLREAFKNVALPVKTKDELLHKMGGPDRIVVAPGLNGHIEPRSVLDILEALSDFLDKTLPVNSWESLVRQIIINEQNARKAKLEKGVKVKPLLRDIANKNLKKILSTPERKLAALGGEKLGPYRNAFEKNRPMLEALARKGDGSAKSMVMKLKAFDNFSGILTSVDFALFDISIYILDTLNAKKHYADIVSAKTASAITHLNNAAVFLNNSGNYLDNVIAAAALTPTILNYNVMAQNALNSANQLLSQAIADLANAEAALQHIPDNQQAQNAVAEAQNRLAQVQGLLAQITVKMAAAEDHKDILSIPMVSITIHCVEEDPCCDDDWNNVNVDISNETHTNVPDGHGTTSGSGRCTISGRFGNSTIHVHTDGPGGWNFDRTFNVQNHSVEFTITEDLPGWE